MTIDDLAVMVGRGFNDVTSRMATKDDLDKLDQKVEKLDQKVEKLDQKVVKLDHNVEAYNSNVKNYLNLSEKRYSELKQRDALLAQWIKLVAAKTKVPIDVSQLEKI